jgi:hypothetical protein
MYINLITIDNWKGNINNELAIEDVSWELIEKVIRNLDGDTRTLVTLEGDNGENMGIGGGSGLYIVYATLDNEIFYNLRDSNKVGNVIELVVGGQSSEYPSELCVNLDKALMAARAFSENGIINETLEWECDN